MWIVWTCISIILYAFCEIYEKISSTFNEEHSEYKLLIWFGIFGLLVACFVNLFGFRETNTSFISMIIDNPTIVLCPTFYMLSLFFAFISLKLIPVSIETTITNTSGCLSFIGAIVLFIVLQDYQKIIEEVTLLKVILVLVILIITVNFSDAYHDKIEDNEELSEYEKSKVNGDKKTAIFYAVLGVTLAAVSSLCDAANSVYSYYVLREVADSYDYLYFSNMLFFGLGVAAWIYVCISEHKIYNPFTKDQLPKAIGSGLDCLGTVTCVLAINANQFYADPLVSTYFIFTLVLSKFILKEHMNIRQKICVLILIICIVIFAFLEA